MNLNVKPYIILLDDMITEAYPLVDILKNEYGEEQVLIFSTTETGITFIKDNLDKKMIVLLDMMFYGKLEGTKVLREITEETSLVCFIIMTGNPDKVDKSDLIDFINNRVGHFIQRDAPYKQIMKIIKDAENNMTTRVDSALQEWILRYSPEEQNKPYLKTRNGQSYTLLDILKSVRKGEEFGSKMVKGILNLAIDLLARDKQQLED